MNPAECAFLDHQRVARLATADAGGAPHLVPVCFSLDGENIYITIDRKPKRGDPRRMKRLVNIAENPAVALVVDHYEEDWTRLGWVMVRGRAEVLAGSEEHTRAQNGLRERYPQYRQMQLEDLPVIAIRIERVTSWGQLEAHRD